MEEQNKLQTMRHSASHIMATAVKKLYPGTKLGIGPAIENGFYYDFDLKEPISQEDLPKIEAEMKKIVAQKFSFVREEISANEAKKIFKDEPYKLELISDLEKESEKISIYRTGDFVDLCAGPHVSDTSRVGSFKLLSVAGAYWKGSEKNKMLTRIYGTAFENKEELDNYSNQKAEAEKRDHRRLGKELDLFSLQKKGRTVDPFYQKSHLAEGSLSNASKNFGIKVSFETLASLS